MRDGLWLMAGVFLFYCAYSDLRCGMISVKSCLLAAGAGVAVRVVMLRGSIAGGAVLEGLALRETIAQGDVESGGLARRNGLGGTVWTTSVRGLIPGMLAMGLAVGSEEQIGRGDAWILFALGGLIGAGRCVRLFVTALIISLPFAAVWCLLCRRKGIWGRSRSGRLWERRIPFAPSLFLAYMLLSFIT